MKYLLPLLFPTFVLAQAAGTFDVDPVLDRLDAAGKNLKSFTANVQNFENNSDTGDAVERTGRVWYALDATGNPRIHVQLLKRIADGKSKDDKVDYLLAGTDLIDRNEHNRSQNTHHILKPGEKLDLFKLGTGPFPLPIGQSKQDVHGAFDVTAVVPAADDPSNTDHLQLKPKNGTRLARDFQAIDVWSDKQTGMPARIATRDKRGDSARTTELIDVKLNEAIPDDAFTLPKINPDDWQVIEDEFQR